ncbi:MAG: 16S rRNA (guanine(527)-N(7))-methyltransferase RsmG [Rhodothermales bacterium]|nr:16S rRNA (guanine(527)-N(7))-methyltransferase RsmG [Rhodothermales bacterium]
MAAGIINSPEIDKQLKLYADLLLDYNARVNLISRKSTRVDVEWHIAHCLRILKKPFEPGTKVIDWGSGGGLPAIPLAIACSDIEVIAVETTGKKAVAIQHFMSELGLENLKVWRGRAEEYPGKYHYSTSRATASLVRLWSWHIRGHIPITTSPETWQPGLIALKGGVLGPEIDELRKRYPKCIATQEPVGDVLGKASDDKYLVHVTRSIGRVDR